MLLEVPTRIGCLSVQEETACLCVSRWFGRLFADGSSLGVALVFGANGGLAQLGEHLLCKQGVVGSIPSSSTTFDESCSMSATDLEFRRVFSSAG